MRNKPVNSIVSIAKYSKVVVQALKFLGSLSTNNPIVVSKIETVKIIKITFFFAKIAILIFRI